jgi:hypothetical protein
VDQVPSPPAAPAGLHAATIGPFGQIEYRGAVGLERTYVQGVVNLLPGHEATGGFVSIPGSHLMFGELANK